MNEESGVHKIVIAEIRTILESRKIVKVEKDNELSGAETSEEDADGSYSHCYRHQASIIYQEFNLKLIWM